MVSKHQYVSKKFYVCIHLPMKNNDGCFVSIESHNVGFYHLLYISDCQLVIQCIPSMPLGWPIKY